MPQGRPYAYEIIQGNAPNPGGPYHYEVLQGAQPVARASNPVAELIGALLSGSAANAGAALPQGRMRDPFASVEAKPRKRPASRAERKDRRAMRDERTQQRGEGITAGIQGVMPAIDAALQDFRAAGGLSSPGAVIPRPPQAFIDAAIAGGARNDAEIDSVFDLFLEGPSEAVTAQGVADKLALIRRGNMPQQPTRLAGVSMTEAEYQRMVEAVTGSLRGTFGGAR